MQWFIGIWTRRIINGESICIFGDGTQTRTFCFYTDFFIGVLKAALNAKSLVLNIGRDEEEIGMYSLGCLMNNLTGNQVSVTLIEPPEVFSDEPQRRVPNINRAKSELDFLPQVKLKDQIERFYNWAKQNYKY